MDQQNRKRTYLIYSICIFFNHFAFGITSNLLWATLNDLSRIYQTNTQTINLIGTFASLGYLIGSLSGFVYKWLPRQLVLICMVAIISLTMTFVPFYSYIPLLFGMITLNGIGGGSWDSSNNVWLVEMWPEKHASVIQSSQFMYGLGTIVSPLLVSPFVIGQNASIEYNNGTVVEEKNPSIWIPFTIVGLIQMIVPVIFAVLYVVKRYEKPPEQTVSVIDDDDEQLQDSDGERPTLAKSWKMTKILLVALLLACYDAAELGYFYFSPTMLAALRDKNGEEIFKPDVAAHILSVMSAFYTLGRLVTAFVSLKLKPDVILTYHLAIIVIAQSTLYHWRHDTTAVYLATAVLGYGFSAMWPAILAFTERYLKLSDRVGSFLFFFAGLVTLFTPFMLGDELRPSSDGGWPEVLFVFEGGYVSATIILFVTVKLLLAFTI